MQISLKGTKSLPQTLINRYIFATNVKDLDILNYLFLDQIIKV